MTQYLSGALQLFKLSAHYLHFPCLKLPNGHFHVKTNLTDCGVCCASEKNPNFNQTTFVQYCMNENNESLKFSCKDGTV